MPTLSLDRNRPNAPLGFAPYELHKDPETNELISEYKLGFQAIDASFDAQPKLPSHVQTLGKVALFQEFQKQADRNMVDVTTVLPEAALRSEMAPDELVELLHSVEPLRVAELARHTHVNIKRVSSIIVDPIESALLDNDTIDTLQLNEGRHFKTEFTNDRIVTIGVKEARMTHLNRSIVTQCRRLFILDMLDDKNPLHHRGANLLQIMSDHIDDDDEYPSWMIPGVTTYYAYHPERLKDLSPGHRDRSPNLQPYKRVAHPELTNVYRPSALA